MNNQYLIGLAAWLFPGAGHFLQGAWQRGLIVAVVVLTMFGIALWGGGAYYPGFGFKDGALLYLLNIFARFGCGATAVTSYLFSADAPATAASWATFEYSGRFLEVAGLINYLAVIDAIDIKLRRKK